MTIANGTENWAMPTGSPVTGVTSTIGMVFCESANGTASAYRVKVGELVWLFHAAGALATAPALSDNGVVMGGEDTGLYVDTPFGLPMI